MKTWKEHANLFANGKFQVKFVGVHQIIGFCAGDKGRKYKSQFHIDTGKSAGWINVDGTTLIARKIEDMSDDEINSIKGRSYNADFCQGMRETLIEHSHKDIMEASYFRYLLSVGVYPGPQYHFKDGTVIDIKTI